MEKTKEIIEAAFRANPATLMSEDERLATMMDDVVESVEAGEVTEAAKASAEAARQAGVISWGSENGVVIGTMVDGTRIDVNGKVITPLEK